jgi:hypothetical protein
MMRRIPGLCAQSPRHDESLEGIFLVRVDRVFYRWHPLRPFFVFHLAIVEPGEQQGRFLTGRLYCTPKAMWKLNWFLRDFRYDTDLLGREEIDDRALVGLRGVVRLSHTTLNGRSYPNLEAFAPAEDWEELRGSTARTKEVRHDL